MLDEFTNAQSIFTTIDKAFNSNMKTAYRETDLNALLDKIIAKMKKQVENPKVADSKLLLKRFYI